MWELEKYEYNQHRFSHIQGELARRNAYQWQIACEVDYH